MVFLQKKGSNILGKRFPPTLAKRVPTQVVEGGGGLPSGENRSAEFRETAKAFAIKLLGDSLPASPLMGLLFRIRMPNQFTELSPTTKMINSSLEVEIRPTSVWLTLKRPGAGNALSPELITELDSALTQALSLPDVRTVVITGYGTVFCAGADLRVAGKMVQQGETHLLAGYMEAANDLLDRIEDFPLPVIAGVNGAALAGGLELLLACDLAVAASRAPIGDVHVGHGFVPAWGATRRLERAVGVARARRLMLTGATLPAEDLPELFTEVVPLPNLEGAVGKLVNEISSRSPTAIAEAKKLLGADPLTRSNSRRREWSSLERQLATSDLAEGLSAFRSGRPPVFERVRSNP